MKITLGSLRNLIREALDGDRIVPERPWTVEVTFSLGGGVAEDSEGRGPDGFALVLKTPGVEMDVAVDSYWNPQSGDESGNSLKVSVDGTVLHGGETYVPIKFDDGKKQRLIVSSSPVSGLLSIAHAASPDSLPVVYLTVPSPFIDSHDEDIGFEVRPLGNGDVDAEITDHVNL